MKKHQLLLTLAVLPLLAACGKDKPEDGPETPVPPVETTETVTFKVSAETLPTGPVGISVNYGAMKPVDLSGAGTFTLDLDKDGAPFTFLAASPYAALDGNPDAASQTVTFTVPNTQKPLADAPDGLTQVLFAATEEYAEVPGGTVDLKLVPAVAYGKLTLSGISGAVSKVNLTFDANVTGSWTYHFSDGSLTAKKGSKVIALDGADVTDGVYRFAVVPQAFTSVKVEVVGVDQTWSREIAVELSPKAGETFDIDAVFIDAPSLNGSNYYPMILDDGTFSYLGDKVVHDCRLNDINKFFYVWGDTYGWNEPAETGFYGQEGGYLSFTVKDDRWWSAGALYIKPESGVDLKGIGAEPDKYYFHMAFKGTSTAHMIGISNGSERYDFVVGVGSFSDHGVTASALTPVSGEFVPDEWNEYEFPISESGVDFSKDLVNDGDGGCNILIVLSGPTVTGDGPVALAPSINLDAMFIYKK